MFIVTLAGVSICIENKYNRVRRTCRDYITPTAIPEITVSVTDEEIACEMYKSNGYSAGYCESICLYRRICERMLEFDAFLFHSAVVSLDGEGYLFAAPSGTGKTTHAELWIKHFGDRAKIINGDKPLLRKSDNGFMAYGTPWCGKEGFNTNTCVPVKAICFIERAENNSIRAAKSAEVVSRFFHQVIRPSVLSEVTKSLELSDFCMKNVEFYILSCNMTDEAVVISYDGMKGNANNEN